MKASDRILLAAEDIFSENSFEQATVKMICDQAGVNIAAVNYHFQSKQNLYLQAIAAIYGRIHHQIEAILNYEPRERTQQAWALFVAQLTMQFVRVDTNEDIRKWHKIIFRELSHPSEVYDDIYELHFFPILDKLHSLIRFFFPEKSREESFMWFIALISQVAFIRSSESMIIKYQGPEFYSQESLAKYAGIVSQTLSRSLTVTE